MKMDPKFAGKIYKAKDGTIVPHDEYIVFLVKDTAFARVLPKYLKECQDLGADATQIAEVEAMIARVTTWRRDNPHRVKIPDAAGELLFPTNP